MTADFTRDGYRVLLQALLDRGYTDRTYEQANPSARNLILRHDLDMSLLAAVPIAKIEGDLGLRAHYFVLLRTEMYSVFSDAGLKALLQIQEQGHEIGLHLDASLYDDTLQALETAAAWECSILEDALQTPVRCISFHRPAPTLLGMEQPLGRPAFTPIRSDSSATWAIAPIPAAAGTMGIRWITRPWRRAVRSSF